jgi:hypothetical protein
MLSGRSLKKMNHSKIFIVTGLGLEGAWYWQTLIVVLCLGLFYGVWGRSLFYRKRLHHISDSHLLRYCYDHVRNSGCQCWQPCSLCTCEYVCHWLLLNLNAVHKHTYFRILSTCSNVNLLCNKIRTDCQSLYTFRIVIRFVWQVISVSILIQE